MSAHTPQTKAAALAAILGGESINSVSRRTGIGRNTLTRWRTEAGASGTLIAQQKKEAIGQQLYGLLEEYIAYLRFEVRATQDEAWIRRQRADALAIYHGVVADKSVRLAAALRPPTDGDSDR
jgi:transposase-like protein